MDVDIEQREVLHEAVARAPEHASGLLPPWLTEHGVDIVIAGGLGALARDLLSGSAVQLLIGVRSAEPGFFERYTTNRRQPLRPLNTRLQPLNRFGKDTIADQCQEKEVY